MGTVGYMSPEQASGVPRTTAPISSRSASSSTRCSPGGAPSTLPTPVETLSAIIRDEPPPIAQLDPSVPAPVRWIVERCLAKAPADRYASTRDLARDLATARDRLSELTTRAPRRRQRVATAKLGDWRASRGAWRRSRWSRSAWRSGGCGDAPTDPGRLVRFAIASPEDVIFLSTIGSPPFAVSPDGRRLAFTASALTGGVGLWIRSFDSLDPRPLRGTEGASNPFWSPDGLGRVLCRRSAEARLAFGGRRHDVCEAQRRRWWNVESRRRDPVRAGTRCRPVPGGGVRRHADVGHRPRCGARRKRPHRAGVPARWPSLPVPDHGARQRPGIYAGSLDSPRAQRVVPEGSPFAFSSPDRLLFVRERTLMAQRFDLNRLEVTGEPIRVAEGVAPRGRPPRSTRRRAVRSCTGRAAGTSRSRRGCSAMARRAARWDRRARYVNVALSPDGRQVAVDRFDAGPRSGCSTSRAAPRPGRRSAGTTSRRRSGRPTAAPSCSHRRATRRRTST